MKKSVFSPQDSGKFFLWAVLAPQLLTFVVEILLILVAQILGTTTEELFNIKPIYITFIMLAQIAFVFVITFCGKGFDFKKAFHFEWKMPLRNWFICALIGVVAVFALSPIVTLFDELLVLIGYNSSSVGFEITSVPMMILGIVLMALVPAVLEELIFRGAIFRGLQRYGKWVAILSTSALFALMHCNPEQLIFPFVVSIFMCLTVLKADNILGAITIHFFANATSVVLSYFTFYIMEGWSTLAIVATSILLAVLGGAIMYLLTTLLKPQPQQKIDAKEVLQKLDNTFEETDEKPNNAFLKIGIILALVLFVATTAVGFMPTTT